MDDCLVHSKFADHLQDLTNLFQSLIDNGLKISPKKCQFFQTELVYMGLKFLIYNGRPSITPMKDKCEAIRRLDPPKTVRDCRKFCGMVNFLATFLKDLQKILIPIYNLTQKSITFLWSEECQQAFDHIKFLLSNPPILRMPDMTGTFQLMSDTSTLAAGAALYQYQGSAFYIVGYNSKKLSKAVQNYSVTELELFGLVVDIYAFKQLLTNVYFEVFCDHSAIVQILNGKMKLPTRRIQRLIEHLLPFNFTVHCLPGNKMHIADILSRLAGKDLEPSDQLIPISFNVHTRSTRPLKQYYANKQKTSIPYKIVKLTNMLPRSLIQPAQPKRPPKISIQLPKPTTQSKTPPVPIGILRKITRRIQRLIEHLLPFNFTVHYLPGNKMHIADILSRLAGKDLEPSDQLIPIPFNVHTRSTRPLKQYYANKQKTSIPYKIVKPTNTLPRSLIQPAQPKRPPKISIQLPKPTTQSKTPPVPIGILCKIPPTKPLPPQKEPRKSLVDPHLKIPQSLPPLKLPPPQSKETIETYRSPEESLYCKPLPILKDAEELDVFTRHIPKQTDIDKFLQILKAKVTKSYDLSVTATELVK